MSDTQAEHDANNDVFDLERHIEKELIQGSSNRLRPIIENTQQIAVKDSTGGSSFVK